jgi:putative two-component system response regulator
VLVVDDSAEQLIAINAALQDAFEVALAGDAETALILASRDPPELILLDTTLPGRDGFDLCRRLKALPAVAEVPVIFLVAQGAREHELRAFRAGAVDYVGKPIVPETLRARVATHVRLGRSSAYLKDQNRLLEHLVSERTAEKTLLRDATLHALASLAEFRQCESGNHLRRTAHYVAALAHRVARLPQYAAELTSENIHAIFRTVPLHDIGKVGIPDRILLSPRRLDAAEFAVMQRHTALGRDVIQNMRRELGGDNLFLRYAAQIAYAHHEKWDGSGYPLGLAGDAIPLAARLMAIADVYDALISFRPYKPPLSHADAIAHLVAGRGRHFDPDLIDALLPMQARFADIAARFPDEDPPALEPSFAARQHDVE